MNEKNKSLENDIVNTINRLNQINIILNENEKVDDDIWFE
jgi:hypothetical protein